MWRVEFERNAERELGRLDPVTARRILAFLNERVLKADDPRISGRALEGSRFGNLWRYRVGDYRIIASIDDTTRRIIVVRVRHRREVYRS